MICGESTAMSTQSLPIVHDRQLRQPGYQRHMCSFLVSVIVLRLRDLGERGHRVDRSGERRGRDVRRLCEHALKTVFVVASVCAFLAVPAAAEIRVLDPVTGTQRVVVRDDRQDLLGVNDDGAALFVRSGRDVLRVSIADGAATVTPQFADAESIGPGGRWAGDGEIHAPDGRTIATYDVSPLDAGEPPRLAWSRDGTRVAVLSAEYPLDTEQRLLVFDTVTGAVLARRARVEDVAPQAFAPDGN